MARSALCAPAAVRLTLRFPFWTEVFYSMTIHDLDEAKAAEMGIPTQATDGRSLWVNAKFFRGIPLEQQVAELVHELGHKIFLHASRRGAREPRLWNIACDYVINAMMKKNGFPIEQYGDWLLDMKYEGWLAERVYADLLQRRKQQPQPQPGSGKGQGTPQPGNGDPQLATGRQDLRDVQGTPEEIERHESEVKALVDRAIASAKAMGKLPLGIEAGTVATFKPAREPWYNHLHRYMQTLCTSNYNWARLNRRTLRTHRIFTPLHLSEALGDVAVFIDTSGSCYAAASQMGFASHLNAILAEAKPRKVHLYYFDTQVYPGEQIEAGELDVVTKPRGGGGTSFEPIFEQLDEDGVVPDVCIILTDLYGSFPNIAPEYPVVWACIEDGIEAPFGETIHVCD
jgi:predicted metal-dependent peptidase